MRIVIVLAVLCGVVVIGCGQSAEQERQAAEKERAALQARRDRIERGREQAAYQACSATFSGLQDSLSELDSRLSVGLDYEDYGRAVADARVAYDKIDFQHLRIPYDDSLRCLGGVGVPLERALNQYTAAYERWDTCFGDYSCDVDSIKPELQAHWSKAGRSVAKARDDLAAMEPATTIAQ